jgi:hypothetical protein
MSERVRPFTIFDGMIFVAATALAIVPLRYFAEQDWTWKPGPTSLEPYLTRMLAYSGAVLTCWSLAALVLSLRKPRRALRRLALRPRFAFLIVALVETIRLGLSCISKVLRSPSITGSLIFNYACNLTDTIGRLTSILWLVLALSGRWRPGQSWTDRLAWLLGAAFIAISWFNFLYYTFKF